MKPYIIIPTKKNFEIILIKVPYDAIFWTIYHSFFNTNSNVVSVKLKDKSNLIIKIPDGNYVYNMRLSYLLNQPKVTSLELDLNDTRKGLIKRLTNSGYNVINPLPRPDYKDPAYYDGTRRYVVEFYDWHKEQKKLDDFLIYYKYPIIPDDYRHLTDLR